MERMTKADFWDKIQLEYAEEMGEFKDWIDEYKRREEWDQYFNRFCTEEQKIKFHHLPNAMQIGIFIQYTIEQGGESFFQPGAEMWTMGAMIHAIRQWFYDEHRANQIA